MPTHTGESQGLLLTSLHELNAVFEENVSVLIAESFCFVRHLPSVMLDCKPSREPHVVFLPRQLHPMKFLMDTLIQHFMDT